LWRVRRHTTRARSVCWRWLGRCGRSILLRMPQAVLEAADGPARSSMRSAPMPHLLAPARANVPRRGCGQPPCHRCQDRDRITVGRGRRVRRKDGPQLGCGLHQLRPSTHHSQRPVSGHVEQRLPRQPVAVVEEFSDRAALIRRHWCSPPTPGRPPWHEDHREHPSALSVRDVVAVAPPTAAGRPVRHRLAPGRRCQCRPGPSAGPGRRPGRRPKRRAVQVIRPLRDLRRPKRVPRPVAVDARRRQWFLPCRHASRACPIEPPLSHRARNHDRPHHPHKPVENRVPPVP
jgi:hypothetical protein